MAFVVESNFFWSFKTGDNVVYNLRILNYLYELYNQGGDENKKLLIKPIVIFISSVIEAILHDFHSKIQGARREGVASLTDDILNYIRGKSIDEFEKYIASSRKHNLFDRNTEKFYDRLNDLRLIRNRIHIQNTKCLKPEDEDLVFREEVKILAEKCAEIVLKVMSGKFYRPVRSGEDLYVPWDEHFPNLYLDRLHLLEF